MDHQKDTLGLESQTPKLQKRMLTFMLGKDVPPIPSQDERLPFQEKYANVFLKILFTWLMPVMKVGYKRTLVPEDMYMLTDEMKVEYLSQIFYKNFDIQIAKAKAAHIKKKNKNRYPLLQISEEEDLKDFELSKWTTTYALFLTFRTKYLTAVALLAVSQLSQVLNPLLTKKLIKYVEYKTFGIELGIGKGVGYAIGGSLLVFLNGITLNNHFYRSMSVGVLSKAVLTKVLLDKSFKVNAESKHKFPVGKITSIMGTDLLRIDFALGLQTFVIVFPIPIITAIVILIVNLGAVALVGIALMLVFVVMMAIATKRIFVYRKKATIFTDSRVNYIKECLNNLRIIKYYSWERPYFDNISQIRSKEMNFIYVMQVVKNMITAFAINLASLCSMITFVVAYAINGSQDPANIFSSLSIFGVLTQVFFLMPMALAAGSDALVGIKRVGEFISSPEVDLKTSSIDASPEAKAYMDSKDLSIKVDNASFIWELFDDDASSKEKSVKNELKEKDSISSLGSTLADPIFTGLRDVDFEIKKGEFVVITGVIGSGKSSLLNALSGFMKRVEGEVSVNGSLILCGQPWIQNSTVKENIVFGQDFDEKKYADVIYSCSLESDLSILPAGDRTEIGERGITLSGGQKARINLARAVYADQEIILLDDVLSAVDARVGRHIMDQCFMGLLKNKTRILATHQLSLIGAADRIIFLNGDGSLTISTSEELERTNDGFKKLMTFSQTSDSDSESQDVEEEIEEEKEELQKQISKVTVAVEDEEAEHKAYNTDKTADGTLVLQENKSENSVGFKVIKRYFVTGSGKINPIFMLVVLVILIASATFCFLFANVWLSFWTSRKFDISDKKYIGIYVMFCFLSLFLYMLEFVLVAHISNRSSTYLNIKAVKKVLYSPMSFLDTTPMGRILNRFTKDTDVLDNEIGEQIRFLTYTSGLLIGIFVLCIAFMPYFAIAVPVLLVLVLCAGSFYSASCREAKRLESVQRSFVYNNFNESLNGMDTIKAYKANDRFLDLNSKFINNVNEAYLIFIGIQRWLTINLSMVSSIFTLIISLLCVNKVFDISASSSGLLLSYTLQITGMLSIFMRNYTQVENGMNSVERICDFAYDLPSEAPYEIAERKPQPSWPESGEVQFDNICMSYRPGLPLVLKNLNFNIKSQEKIGICGRTGAGKSSIMTALYRLSEPSSGKIIIDGVNISEIGLNDLRSKLSIIPQDPVLFKGSIRRNLDPFGQSSDDKLWDSLRRAGLIEDDKLEFVRNQTVESENLHKFHLEQTVEDEGTNFSLGERQLVAFARALVRESKILILDEATSSVDYETDSKIQRTIASEFNQCTILCIAHRLKTIVNYDKILVLDHGEVKEFDSPWNLFNRKDGIFQQMCQKSSIEANVFQRR